MDERDNGGLGLHHDEKAAIRFERERAFDELITLNNASTSDSSQGSTRGPVNRTWRKQEPATSLCLSKTLLIGCESQNANPYLHLVNNHPALLTTLHSMNQSLCFLASTCSILLLNQSPLQSLLAVNENRLRTQTNPFGPLSAGGSTAHHNCLPSPNASRTALAKNSLIILPTFL